MVSATREIICLTLVSRRGVPSAPRKYLLTTTLVAICDQNAGISQSVCSNTVSPFSLPIDAVRFSQRTSSNGWTPASVKRRSIRSPDPCSCTEPASSAASWTLGGALCWFTSDAAGGSWEGTFDTDGSTMFPLIWWALDGAGEVGKIASGGSDVPDRRVCEPYP